MENNNQLTPDLTEAMRFLTALAGYENAKFTFQTFDDNEERRKARPKGQQDPFARIFHGHLTDVLGELMKLNSEGAGIHVTVNETDFKGRKKKNIVALRAAFVDSDTGCLPQLKIQPSIVVQSKRGPHVYWLLETDESLEEFGRVQESLIHNLGTDKSVKELNRVMRLPGFFHMKDPKKPVLVRVSEVTADRYSIADILSVYPPKAREQRSHSSASTEQEADVSSFRQWAEKLPTDEGTENSLGGRDKTLHFLICQGLALGVPEEELYKVAHAYCERSGFSTTEADEKIPRLATEHLKRPFKPYGYCKAGTGPFEVRNDGVYFVERDKDGDRREVRICSRLDVVAYTRNASGENWGRLLRWEDQDGRVHEWAMPMEMLKGDGTDFRGTLLSRGLEIVPLRKARDSLAEYVQTARPSERVRCVERIGWHGETFVFPGKSFGPRVDGEQVILQTVSDSHPHICTSGTLEEWKQHVAALCVGNSRLMFSVSMAFASTLLFLLGEESGGFHFRGPSSIGKTTALHTAGSVCGGGGISGYPRKWRATVNGLEAVAQAHCDAVLALDELNEIDSRDAGKAAYMLANGSGKSRADKNGGARKAAEWRTLFISSGEISLADHMNEAGQRIRAGQETRMVDLPADAGKGLGLFENIHGSPNVADFADLLMDGCRKYYGTAILAFLEKLIQDPTTAINSVRDLEDQFCSANIPEGASGQVRRVAGRFALVAAAGERAVEYGIVPWEAGEAMRAAQVCFKAWLAQRGGIGDHEATAAIEQVRSFIQQNPGRFSDLRKDDGNVIGDRHINRVGYTRNNGGKREWLMFPRAFKEEICKGNDPKLVVRVLKECGYLTPDSEGKSTQAVRLPDLGKKPSRVIVINDSIMEGK
jgi:uncharacterized protein (DUF927 family)